MKQVKIHHETRYLFDAPVRLGEHQLRLRPREGPELRIESATLETSPAAQIRWSRDPFDNSVANLVFSGVLTRELKIVSEAIVWKYDVAPLDFLISDYAVEFPIAYLAEDAAILEPFFANFSQDEREAAQAWAAKALGSYGALQTYQVLDRLCRSIKDEFEYQAREEPGVQSARETLERGVGSCRDFANLLMEAARSLGLAARFVSGYRYEADIPIEFAATHAWVEVYLPGAGWKGFDPTTGELAGWGHIATAVARSPTAAPPVAGVIYGASVNATMDFSVEVQAA